MTRLEYIEKTLRQVYGGQPTADSEITINLVNLWLSEATGIAAKQNYKDNFQIEGIGFVNDAFYTTFKSLPIIADERLLWRFQLPEIPLGIGYNEGIATVVFKKTNGELSYPGIPISQKQREYSRSMRLIPNKILFYSEGIYGYAISPILMTAYTASVTMVSGGASTNLNSILNIPPDYFPVIDGYILQQLSMERKAIPDLSNDGRDD
jgi:hypothetical protein